MTVQGLPEARRLGQVTQPLTRLTVFFVASSCMRFGRPIEGFGENQQLEKDRPVTGERDR